jgi:hypothetical protein
VNSPHCRWLIQCCALSLSLVLLGSCASSSKQRKIPTEELVIDQSSRSSLANPTERSGLKEKLQSSGDPHQGLAGQVQVYCGHRLSQPKPAAPGVHQKLAQQVRDLLAKRKWLDQSQNLAKEGLLAPELCQSLFEERTDWTFGGNALKEWTALVNVEKSRAAADQKKSGKEASRSPYFWLTLWGPRVSFQKRNLQDLGDFEIQSWILTAEGKLVWKGFVVCGPLEGQKLSGCDESFSQYPEILEEQLVGLDALSERK